jgi:hypothetical protein
MELRQREEREISVVLLVAQLESVLFTGPKAFF